MPLTDIFKKKSEKDRYLELEGHSDKDGHPYIGSICVAGRATCWRFRPRWHPLSQVRSTCG